jgi:polar amino acid transport system substrate-binding protein
LQRYKTGELIFTDLPVPTLLPQRLLVHTAASLVSVGTEKYMLELAKKSLVGKALARPDLVRRVLDKAQRDGILEAWQLAMRRLDMPIALGYSSAGVVIDVGPGVDGFSVGDRVACTGSGYAGHTEVASVPANLCAQIPEGLDFGSAAFVALGGIALEAVRMARISLGETVVVIGLGLLGQIAVQLLDAAGCHVIGMDIDPEKCKMALQHGAEAAAADYGQLAALCLERTAGHGADAVVILAATSSNEPLEQAAELCRERGRVVAAGLVGLEIPRKPFYDKELELVVSRAWGPGLYDPNYAEKSVDYPLAYARWTAQRNMAEFLAQLAKGAVRVNHLTTHTFPFDQALEAYELILEEREPYIGVVLTYPETPDLSTKVDLGLAPGSARESKPVDHKSEIAVGFIGAGQYTRGTLLPALKKVEGIRYVGVTTASGRSGRDVGDKAGFVYCATDHVQLLEDTKIDAIFVLTRHGSHARFVSEALRAGKAVFVEKPLALDREELAEVVRALQETDGFLMVGFNRRFAPTTEFVRVRLQSGTGPLVVHVRCNAGFIPPDSWVHDPVEGGGRIIGEVCHFVDLVQALTGELPTEVHVAAAGGAYAELHDNLAVSLTLDGGSVASIVYAAGGDKSFPREYVEVFGRGAAATIENFKAASFTQSGKTAKKRSWLSVDRGHVGELDTFIGYLRAGKSQPVSLREYVATSLTTFAMEESITSGQPVMVDTDSFLREILS